MKRLLPLILAVFFLNIGKAQTTWSEHAAAVFYANCTACHNPNGIAPNSLMTYTDAYNYSAMIQNYVTNNIMPPWTADTAYAHYSQERILTQNERDILLNWISDGSQEGDPALAPPPPVYSGDQVLPGVPDMVVTAPNYMSKATTQDDYVCFVIPSGLAQNRKVKAIEVIPGNREIVHHCLVYSDDTGFPTTDTSGNCAGPVTSELMGGYTPGSTPIIFPSTGSFATGMELTAGCDIVLAMHYPEGSYGMYDQTKVNFYFYDEPVSNFRPVACEPIIQNWSFSIAANTIDSVVVSTGAIPSDYTLLSVFPHMHLIGKYIQSWGITPSNDTLKFTRVPEWDFEWQDFYWFQYMRYIPAGTDIFGKGIWDNTASNPNNPNDPPITISAGLNTSDEMFLIYFHYMDYQAGDENVNVDSLTTEFLSLNEPTEEASFATAYPNPFKLSTDITYQLSTSGYVSIYIYDIQGKMVKKLVSEQQPSGVQKVTWNGTNDAGENVKTGMYFYSALVDGQHFSGKLLKR
ncbi:MAG: T9SS type A sorting domain-containing protein [Crocinitomicaceae bacterium]|nr:T9SS type A sorting domain-containing protein [Crocinitomicaceae bacterium]